MSNNTEHDDEERCWHIEIERVQGRVSSALYTHAETGEEVAEAFATQTYRRSFWQGWLVDPLELSCLDLDDRFLWRVYTHRRGLSQGLSLSLSSSDDKTQEGGDAHDPLWTLGTLGREEHPPALPHANDLTHLFLPRNTSPNTPPERQARVQSLFVRVDRPGTRFRLLIEDEDRSLFATVEPETSSPLHVLRTWDGRSLATLETVHIDPQGAELILYEEPDSLEDPLCDALAHALPCIATILAFA